MIKRISYFAALLVGLWASMAVAGGMPEVVNSGGGGGGTATPAGASGAYQYNNAGVLAAGSVHESATSVWAVNTAGGVIWEQPKAGVTIFATYNGTGSTIYTVQASGVSVRPVQVSEIGFSDGTKQRSAAAAVAGSSGQYMLNNAGALGGGSVHESGGSIFCVSATADRVIWAAFSATGEFVRYWPSGTTQFVQSTARWTQYYQSGNTEAESDATGTTTYATDGTTVRYGTYAWLWRYC